MMKCLKCGYWSDIGKKAKRLSEFQQALLWSYFGCRIVIIFRMANSAEQNGVTFYTCFQCCIRKRTAGFIDRICTHEAITIMKLMTKLLCNGIQYSHRLFGYFRADAIT